MDIGQCASDHMCLDLATFSSLEPIQTRHHTITIPDGKELHVTHQGHVDLG